MQIEFTKHARRRIIDRKIELVWIYETLKFPDNMQKVGNEYIITRKLNGKTLEIVIMREKNINIITLYWL